MFPKTVIIRHKKENLKKCSLRGLESRDDMLFYTYPIKEALPIEGYITLVMEGAPLLSKEDAGKGLLFLDSTWRYLPAMVNAVESKATLEKRTLPSNFRTAYPREQTDCLDPERGLSTLEAIYISYNILGRDVSGLLDRYYWKDQFLLLNKDLF